MARTKVNFEKKKKEILHSVWDILFQYGYEGMTISVIIKEISISKGAFYHYFQSKEECVDEAISEYVNSTVAILEDMDTKKDSATIRLQKAIQNGVALFHNKNEQEQFMNQPENAVFHQKLMIAFTKYLSQYYCSIIQDGIENHELETTYPLEVAEMLLTLCNFYLDSALFGWEIESIKTKILALEELANKALGTKEFIPFFNFGYQEEIHV